jgi:hypothetical protein
VKILLAYKNSLHALQVLLRPSEGKERMIRTPSDKVQISNNGRKYYFVEVCDDRSCRVIEAYGEEAEELWNAASTRIKNKS